LVTEKKVNLPLPKKAPGGMKKVQKAMLRKRSFDTRKQKKPGWEGGIRAEKGKSAERRKDRKGGGLEA